MKQILAIGLVGALLLTGCTANTTASAETVTAQATAVTAAAATATAVETLADPVDETKAASGAFSITGGSVTESGSVYTITAAGEYTLTGVLEDGQIVVDAGDEDEVKLVLENVSLSSSTDAPITVLNASEVTVSSPEGSYNTVTDARTGSADAAADSEDNHDAAIWAACDLKVSGNGTLIVETAYDNGIKSKDDLTVKNVTLKVTATGNALKGNDSVEIKSGNLILVSTASDGVKTENTDVSSKGNQRGTVSILGGHVEIYAACDGISAAYDVVLNEDEEALTLVIVTGESAAESSYSEKYLIVPISLYDESSDYYAYFYNEDDTAGVWVHCTYDTMVYSGRTASYYGLVCKVPSGYSNVLFNTVASGTTPDGTNYTAATTGDTINASMNAFLIESLSSGVIDGDWVQLSSGSDNSSKTTYSSKGIKAANEILVTAGTIDITASDDGIHANGGDALENGFTGLGNVTIKGGTLTIASADDGIHADNALTIDGGTVNVTDAHEGLEGNVITQNGGSVTVYGDDDGINACAGSTTPLIQVNGGTLDVTTPSGDTDAIDSNGNVVITGGFVLVKGGAQMGNMAGSVDADGSVTVTGGTIVSFGGICQLPSGSSVNTYVSSGTSFSAGDYTLTDASGSVIASFTLPASYSSVWIASDAFTTGGSYALNQNGTAVLSWTQSSQTEGNYSGGMGGFGGMGGGFGGGFGGRGGRH